MISCGSAWLSPALALCAAFLFAVGIQFSRLGLRHTDARTAALIQIGASTALYWIAAPVFVEAAWWVSPAVALFAAIGVFRPFLSANLALAGTKRLGPTISSTLSATAPFFGVALGVFLLGESITVPIAAGTAGIVAGVVVLSWRDGAVRHDWPLWALALPIGAAVLRTLAQALAKIGMETLPSAFFVGLVGYTVSFVIALAVRARGGGDAVRGPGFKWLVFTGTVNGISILALNVALQCGPLTVVSPIVACSPMFSLFLGLTVFGERTITRRAVVAVLLVVPGVVAISLSR